MTAILVAGFGVVVSVNFLMATLAVRGFGGVVVENSYVASQQFNGWLREAERQKSLGWSARMVRGDDGRLFAETSAVPIGAQVTALLRRPVGVEEFAALRFTEIEPGRFASDTAVPPGRWIVRLRVYAQGKRWSHEEPLR